MKGNRRKVSVIPLQTRVWLFSPIRVIRVIMGGSKSRLDILFQMKAGINDNHRPRLTGNPFCKVALPELEIWGARPVDSLLKRQ